MAFERSDMEYWRATICMPGNSLRMTSSKPASRSMVDLLPGACIDHGDLALSVQQRGQLARGHLSGLVIVGREEVM
jgi:hypothetical protein